MMQKKHIAICLCAIAGAQLPGLLNQLQTATALPNAEPGGINANQIQQLAYYATAKNCTAEGCTLTLKQSVSAMHGRFGIPARYEEWRDMYPIAGSSDGVLTPMYVQIFYQSKNYQDSVAYQAFIPAYTNYRRVADPAPVTPTPSPPSPPASSASTDAGKAPISESRDSLLTPEQRADRDAGFAEYMRNGGGQ